MQLPLSLPTPAGSSHVDRYVDSLLGTASDLQAAGTAVVSPSAEGSRAQEAAPAAAGVASGQPASRSGEDVVAGNGSVTARALPDEAPGVERGELRPDLVRRIEDAIRRGSPTVETLPQVAREAQAAVLGGSASSESSGGLLPEALEAANRVFVELYSDSDARDAIVAALPALDSANPREIKRFINLFRFYTFIAQQDRLRGVPAPDGPEIAKLAVLAIRWPHLLNALGSRLPADGAPTVLARLEEHARAEDGQPGSWGDALLGAGLIDDPDDLRSPDLAWAVDLCRFLGSDPRIAPSSERLL